MMMVVVSSLARLEAKAATRFRMPVVRRTGETISLSLVLNDLYDYLASLGSPDWDRITEVN